MVDICETTTRETRDHVFEYRAVADGGRVVWLHDRVRVVRDEQGAPLRRLGVMVEITDRRLAQIGLEALRPLHETVFLNAGDGAFGVDADGGMTFVNPEASRMLGWARAADRQIPAGAHPPFAPDGSPYLDARQ